MEGARKLVGSATGLLVVGFLALLVILGVTFWIGETVRQNFDAAMRAREVGSSASTLRSSLQAAESSQRGFLLTGNQIYLAPYATAKEEAVRQLAIVEGLVDPATAADPSMQRLKAIVAQKLREMDDTIAFKRDLKDDAAGAIMRTNRGKALMDEANIFLSAIIRNADTTLTTGVGSQKEGFSLLRAVTIAAVLLIVIVTGIVVWLIASFVRDLQRAKNEVSSLNTDLERRVERRTAELKQARDRAEVLLAEVNHRVANGLAMVASMVGMQARAAESAEIKQLLAETQGRINAVALVHKKLYTSSDVRVVALADFLPGLLDQLEASLRDNGYGLALRHSIDPLNLPTDQTVSLGVIATEWVTNAFKYAYPDGSGEVRVTLRGPGTGPVELTVEDDGIGRLADAPARGTGLGTKLVTAMAASLGARVEYTQRSPGTSARLVLPVQ